MCDLLTFHLSRANTFKTTRSKTGSLPDKRPSEIEVPATAPKRQRKVTSKQSKTSQKAINVQPGELDQAEQVLSPGISENATAPQPPQVHNPFFNLPAEIRNEIYTLALTETRPITTAQVKPHLREPGALAVNVQMRAEASSIWYGENTFEVSGSSPAVKWLRSLPEDKLKFLRRVHILGSEIPLIDHAWTRVKSMNREFVKLGLPKTAIRFHVRQNEGLVWANVLELKHMEDEPKQSASKKSLAPPPSPSFGNRA